MKTITVDDLNESTAYTKTKKYVLQIVFTFFKVFFLTGFCFVILYPLLVMASRTFMDYHDLYDNTVLFIPRNFTLDNIRCAIIQIDYFETLLRTVFLTLSVTILQLIPCLMAGYGLARFRFHLNKIILALVIFTIVVPPQLISIPLYFNFKDFNLFGILTLFQANPINLLNTYAPFWLLAITGLGIKNGIFIYLFRQFFKNMPTEISEAGYVDGANSFIIFTKLMVPNAITVIVTCFLFSVVWQYNDGVYSNLFMISKPVFATVYNQLSHLTTESCQILGFTANSTMEMSMYAPIIKSAGILLMLAPLIILFLSAQKYFVQSVERSGIVG